MSAWFWNVQNSHYLGLAVYSDDRINIKRVSGISKRKKAPEGCSSEVHLFEVREKIFKTVKISFYPKQNPHKCKVKTDK